MVANWIECNGYIGREGGREKREGGGRDRGKEGEMDRGRV